MEFLEDLFLGVALLAGISFVIWYFALRKHREKNK